MEYENNKIMKTNELRIGNLLMTKENGNILVVDELGMTGSDYHIHCIPFKKSENIIKIWQAEPIPLSEEILLRCGFDIKPFSLGLTLDRFRFIWKTEYKYWYVVDAYSHSYLTKIEFVHELQNFIFVMNGQELNTSGL